MTEENYHRLHQHMATTTPHQSPGVIKSLHQTTDDGLHLYVNHLSPHQNSNQCDSTLEYEQQQQQQPQPVYGDWSPSSQGQPLPPLPQLLRDQGQGQGVSSIVAAAAAKAQLDVGTFLPIFNANLQDGHHLNSDEAWRWPGSPPDLSGDQSIGDGSKASSACQLQQATSSSSTGKEMFCCLSNMCLSSLLVNPSFWASYFSISLRNALVIGQQMSVVKILIGNRGHWSHS